MSSAEPSGVTVKLLNVCKKKSVRRLAEVANSMLEGSSMTARWRKSKFFRGKGDARSCGNYVNKTVQAWYERDWKKYWKQATESCGTGWNAGGFHARKRYDGCYLHNKTVDGKIRGGLKKLINGFCGSWESPWSCSKRGDLVVIEKSGCKKEK